MTKIREFRPADLPRILEGATPELLDKIGLMAADTVKGCGESRPSMVQDALQTIDDVLNRRQWKTTGGEP